MAKFKLGLIVGSNRRASINRKLAQALVKLGAKEFDASIIRIDDLPLYNQDLETALPEQVVRFKSHIADSDALLFVTPEHSRSMPAEVPVTAAGLPVQEFLPQGRAPQSMALLSTAGMLRLCSGVTNSTASTSVMWDLKRTTCSGSAVSRSWL